jgi:hypothetical protein
MRGRFVGVLLPVVAFFSLAGLAQADMCSFDGPGIPGSAATERCADTGGFDSLAPPFQFTVTQFDPQLGQLQSVNFTFDLFSVSGTASFVYPGVDPSCLAPNVPFGTCASLAVNAAYNITVSATDITPLSFGNSNLIVTDYCCTVGPQTAAWTDPNNGGNLFERQSLEFSAAQASAFIGTGQLTYDIATSANSFDGGGDDTFPGWPASVTLVDYEFEVDYNFTPAATPEPSLFYITGAALLGLIGMRFRRQSV